VTDVQDFTFEAGAEAERLRRAFETFGVVVVKNLLAKDKLAEQRAALRSRR
jgi:ectoine hydroxylase-related dioxygenase (phytanoyl-CoA dioxygenase family)